MDQLVQKVERPFSFGPSSHPASKTRVSGSHRNGKYPGGREVGFERADGRVAQVSRPPANSHRRPAGRHVVDR